MCVGACSHLCVYKHCTINVVGVVKLFLLHMHVHFCMVYRLIVDLASTAWLDALRYLPHLLLAHKIFKVIKEANDALIASKRICATIDRYRYIIYIIIIVVVYLKYLPFLEALHIHNNIVLLPAFGEVNHALGHIVLIAHMHKGQIL